ncbi:MAG TPA: hypothetical protein VL486_02920 [Verrucomicrobiae bacterium]|nr:hypothetical protein [Verrucomicrobiae bacterium]
METLSNPQFDPLRKELFLTALNYNEISSLWGALSRGPLPVGLKNQCTVRLVNQMLKARYQFLG